jgi:FAD/FMN-containing dehydrogenase
MGRLTVERRTLLKSALGVAAASTFPVGNGFAADLQAVASRGATTVLSDKALADLQKNLRGEVILPTSPDYESARHLWNGTFDRHPALIARCAGADDVVSAVQFAKSHDLLVAVRCGGHSYSGQSGCDGGMVIDLSPMKTVEVDAGARIARVAGGTLLGGLDRGAAAHGLGTTAGFVSHTGVGGLTLGGGQGRLQRKFGLTIDNLRGVEIVTADGTLRRANKDENPDLYWAVRGGGGNFGAVTQFEFQLHPLDPTVTAFSFAYPLDKAKDVLKFFFAFNADAPDELNASVGMRTPAQGDATVSISGTYIGPPKAAEAALAKVAAFGSPVGSRVVGANYVELQASADAVYAPGRGYYSRSGFFNRVDPKLADTLVDVFRRTLMPKTSVSCGSQGGFSGRVAQDATAYAHRDAIYQVSVSADWDDAKNGAAYMKYCRDVWAELQPMSDGGFYINQTTDEGEAQIRANYRANYGRLVEVKTKFDPTNFFHLNANIRPKAA